MFNLALSKAQFTFRLSIFSGLFYGFNQFFLKDISSLPFLHFYLNDVLFPLFIIPIFLGFKTALGLRQSEPIFYAEILRYVLLFCIFFEGILPEIRVGATRDSLDCLSYLVGGHILYVLRRFA